MNVLQPTPGGKCTLYLAAEAAAGKLQGDRSGRGGRGDYAVSAPVSFPLASRRTKLPSVMPLRNPPSISLSLTKTSCEPPAMWMPPFAPGGAPGAAKLARGCRQAGGKIGDHGCRSPVGCVGRVLKADPIVVDVELGSVGINRSPLGCDILHRDAIVGDIQQRYVNRDNGGKRRGGDHQVFDGDVGIKKGSVSLRYRYPSSPDMN